MSTIRIGIGIAPAADGVFSIPRTRKNMSARGNLPGQKRNFLGYTLNLQPVAVWTVNQVFLRPKKLWNKIPVPYRDRTRRGGPAFLDMSQLWSGPTCFIIFFS